MKRHRTGDPETPIELHYLYALITVVLALCVISLS